MGEYQAILKLNETTKKLITPLIEVAEVGFDFETRTPNKTVDKHLDRFANRVKAKWNKRPCFVDARLIDSSERMADGRHPVRFIFDDLRDNGCAAIPVTGINRDKSYQQAVKGAVSKDRRGICLRVGIEEASQAGLKGSANMLLEQISLRPDECDFILDLGAPNFEPLEGFAKLVHAIIRKLPHLTEWRTFSLIGTSFPASMAEVKQSPATFERSEWMLYKKIVKSLSDEGRRLPAFGDYAINHPDVVNLDMRLIKPSATIRYTIEDAWFIVKGPNVRDNGYEQYRDHCRTVMISPHYMGRSFSDGDEYIANCADGTGKTGNLQTWRRVGTNHHLEMVVKDISSFFDPSNTP